MRAAQRERAPEDIVRSLPWRVWTGHGWEKHAGLVPGHEHPCTSPPMPDAGAHIDLERGVVRPSTSDGDDNADEPAWAEAQNECAICLSEFEVGDKVRVLPCSHLFHLDEIDAWLINSRKLVSCYSSLLLLLCRVCRHLSPLPFLRCSPIATAPLLLRYIRSDAVNAHADPSIFCSFFLPTGTVPGLQSGRHAAAFGASRTHTGSSATRRGRGSGGHAARRAIALGDDAAAIWTGRLEAIMTSIIYELSRERVLCILIQHCIHSYYFYRFFGNEDMNAM